MFGTVKGANSSGVFSLINRSTTPLGSVGTYLGTYVSCIEFSSIAVACLTDQNATLYIDFSRTDIMPRIQVASTNNLSAQISYRVIKVKTL